MSMTSAQATMIIDLAVKTDWDREFLSNDRIKSWLINEVTSVPFDPRLKTLLDYVKERMAAAEQIQAQQAAPQPAPVASTSTYTPPVQQPQNTSADVAMLDSPVPQEEEEETYQFGLDDFLDPPANDNGLLMDRSPSPLPSMMAISSNQPQQSTSNNPSYPFYNPQQASHSPSQQPSYYPPHQPLQQQNQNHIQQTSVLNPALLSVQNGGFHSTISPNQLAQQQQQHTNGYINPAMASHKRPTSGIDVHLPPLDFNNASQVSPAKRQRTNSTDNVLNSSPPTASSQKSVLKPTAEVKPLTESEKVWQKVEPEIRRNLNLANKAPIGTVQKLFKLLSLYVTEPPNATKTGLRDARPTDLSVPCFGRNTILNYLKDSTQDQFDQCFVTDPRATVLLAEWAKDLASFAKGKSVVDCDDQALKSTSRPLMEVFRKLPISLPVLRTLKGVGRNVNIISQSDRFDEVTKDIATQLVKKWQRMAEAKDGTAPNATNAVKALASKKRPEATSGNTSADSDDTRKKRKVSPTGPPVKVESKPAVKTVSVKQVFEPAASTKPLGAPGKALPAFARRKPAPATKAPPPKPAAPAAPAPAPEAFNPFAIAMQDMKKSMESASGMSLNDTISMLHSAVDGAGVQSVPRASAGKKTKKSVRWESDENLRKVKIVPVLVYGDEFGNEISTEQYFNTTGETLGEGEGAAMKQLTEEMEWEAPPLVDFNLPPDASMPAEYPLAELMGDQKPEAEVQAEREQSVLATTYFNESDIPITPNEPVAVLADTAQPDESDVVKKMRLSYSMENDESIRMAIARARGLAVPPPMQPFEAPLAALQGLAQFQAPLANVYGGAPLQPSSEPSAAGTQDLGALLAKLQNPNAGMTALNPVAPVSQPYGFQQPMHNPIPPYQPPQMAQAYQNGNNWGPPAPGPPGPRNIDWTSLSALPPDAYKRKKGGRKI